MSTRWLMSTKGVEAEIWSKFWPFHVTTIWFLGSFSKWKPDGLCHRRALSQLKKPFIGEGRWGSHEQGNGWNLIQVCLKTWQLTLKLESDHTCTRSVLPWIKAVTGNCNEETCNEGNCMTWDDLGEDARESFTNITPNWIYDVCLRIPGPTLCCQT